MKKKKILAGLLACALIGGAVPYNNYVMLESVTLTASAVDYTEGTYGNFEYRKYSDHVEISGCSSTALKLEIPEKIDGLSVTSITSSAFSGKQIVSVSIPKTVKTIGEKAFSNCNKMHTVTLSDGLESIGDSAFNSCTSLLKINIPDTVTTIGQSAFGGCAALTDVKLSNNLEKLSYNIFGDCTALKSIILPQSLLLMDSSVFSGCTALKSVTIEESENPISISASAFYNCSSLESIVIPDNVIEIGGSAFANCTSLKDVKLGNGLIRILDKAFYQCKGLVEFSIPDSVSTIGDYAFGHCDNLRAIIIPPTVTVSSNNFTAREWERVRVNSMFTEFQYVYYPLKNVIVYCVNDSIANSVAVECNFKIKDISLATDTLLLGDIDNNKCIDASDSSSVLEAYSNISAGNYIGIIENQRNAADVNKDGVINASDASDILAYYSHISAGGKGTLEEYINSK